MSQQYQPSDHSISHLSHRLSEVPSNPEDFIKMNELKYKLIETTNILEKFKVKAQDSISKLRLELSNKNNLLIKEKEFTKELQEKTASNLSATHNELKNLKTQLKSINESKNNLSMKNEGLIQNNDHLKFTVKSNDQEIAYLREVTNNYRNKMAEMEESFKIEREDLEKKILKVKSSTKRNLQTTSLNDSISSDHSTSSTKTPRLEVCTSTSTDHIYTSELSKAKQQLANFQNRNTELLAKLKSQIKENDILKTASDNKDKNIVKLQSVSNGFKARFESVGEKFSQLEKNSKMCFEENERLKGLLGEGRKQIESLGRQNESKDSKIDILGQKLNLKNNLVLDVKNLLKIIDQPSAVDEESNDTERFQLLNTITSDSNTASDHLSDSGLLSKLENIINDYSSTKNQIKTTKTENLKIKLNLEQVQSKLDSKSYEMEKFLISSKSQLNSLSNDTKEKYENIIENLKFSQKKDLKNLEIFNHEQEEKISDLNDEISVLKSKIENLGKKNSNFSEENLTLTTEISNKDLEIKALKSSNKKLSANITHQDEEISENTDKYENIVKNLKLQIENKNNQLENLQNEIYKIEQDFDEFRKNEKNFSQEQVLNFKKISKSNEVLKGKIVEMQGELQKSGLANGELLSKAALYKDEILKLQKDIEDLNKNSSGNKNHLRSLENRIKKFEEYKRLYESLKKSSAEKETNLIKLLDNEKAKLKLTDTQLKSLQSSEKQNINNFSSEKTKLTEAVRLALEKINKLEKINFENENKIDSVNTELDKMKSEKVSLEQTINFQKSNLENLNLDIQKLTQQLKSKETTLNKEKLRIYREKNEATSISSLKNKITNLQSDNKKQKDFNDTQLKKLKAEVACLKTLNLQMKKDLESKSLSLEKYKARYEVAVTKNECSERELAFKNGSDEMLSKKVLNLQGQVVALESDLAEANLKLTERDIYDNSDFQTTNGSNTTINQTELELKSLIPSLKLLAAGKTTNNIEKHQNNPQSANIISLDNTCSNIGDSTLLELGIIAPSQKSTPFEAVQNVKAEQIFDSTGTPVITKSFFNSLNKIDLSQEDGTGLFETLEGE